MFVVGLLQASHSHSSERARNWYFCDGDGRRLLGAEYSRSSTLVLGLSGIATHYLCFVLDRRFGQTRCNCDQIRRRVMTKIGVTLTDWSNVFLWPLGDARD